MKNVFTYGSLMFAPVWERVVVGRYVSAPAMLEGFERLAVYGEEYPVIKPAASTSLVKGLLYQQVGSQDIARLDDFEGEYYQRTGVDVRIANAVVSAETYVLKPAFYHIAKPAPWDEDDFARQGIRRFLQGYKGF
jgi:gamma-glutamylcyclotransferase (GGCT)/AIG2-like uncharacterized protein YtfP